MLKKTIARLKLRALNRKWAQKDYISAYSELTDLKAKIDPAMAIGGIWDEMGRHQFNFLRSHGLLTQHSLLDIGCGSLRGGQYFIDYLDAGHYCGFDLSKGVIDAGKTLIKEKELINKQPDLRINETKNLDFDFVADRRFDFIIAQSVFSHLLPHHIEECFSNIHKVMQPDAVFFFTFHPGKCYRQRSHTDFEYPDSFFEETARKNGFEIEDFSDDYKHPRGQRMKRVRMDQNAGT